MMESLHGLLCRLQKLHAGTVRGYSENLGRPHLLTLEKYQSVQVIRLADFLKLVGGTETPWMSRGLLSLLRNAGLRQPMAIWLASV